VAAEEVVSGASAVTRAPATGLPVSSTTLPVIVTAAAAILTVSKNSKTRMELPMVADFLGN
jgi:hypothetical protein